MASFCPSHAWDDYYASQEGDDTICAFCCTDLPDEDPGIPGILNRLDSPWWQGGYCSASCMVAVGAHRERGEPRATIEGYARREGRTIRYLADLADYLGAATHEYTYPGGVLTKGRELTAGEVEKRIARGIYKGTSSGCPVSIEGGDFNALTFSVYPYCEGFDGDLSGMGASVKLPCRPEDIDHAISEADSYGNFVWMQTHGCEACWGGEELEGEFGPGLVDPECSECEGHGEAI